MDYCFLDSHFTERTLSISLKSVRIGIKLFFTRVKEYSVNDCLYVSTSPTHYEIQRALTFYLAVMGCIPKVKSISLRKGEEEQFLSDMSYTTHWSDCGVQITYDAEVAAKIFAEDGKWP